MASELPVCPDRAQAVVQSRQASEFGALIRRVEIRSARRRQSVPRGKRPEQSVLVLRVAAAYDLDRAAARGPVLRQQTLHCTRRERVTTGMCEHGTSSGAADPAQRVRQLRPAMRHVPWFARNQVVPKCILGGGHVAGLREKTREVSPTHHRRVLSQRERALESPRNSRPLEAAPHLPCALEAPGTYALEPGAQH